MQVCTPCRQPRQHPTTQFFTGRMPFLTPNQQRQSTEGNIRRNRSDLIEVFKIIKGYSKYEINDFFILDNRCKGTRGHSAKLIIIRNNRYVLKFFFSRRVIERWNQLEQHVVDASSIKSFKSHLQKNSRN